MVVEYTESCLVVVVIKNQKISRGFSHLLFLMAENIFFGLALPESKIFYEALPNSFI